MTSTKTNNVVGPSMKLIVQIPCFNEEKTLPQTIQDIPRQIAGISEVEILVIDDGSTDNTIDVARKNGVDHIVKHTSNKGLAKAFSTGMDACLRLGADIIVNTDGDNQYKGEDIPKLIKPILKQKADMVIGDRQTDKIPHFSFSKKKMQKIGSFVVRKLSGTKAQDTVSGFRAFSRETALQLNIVSPFSYTIETLIQAGKKHLTVASVPVGTNPKNRESRLFKSIPNFIERSISTMIRMYTMYQPLRIFFYIGSFFIAMGMIPSIRFLYFYLTGASTGHIQSLILASILFIIGFQVYMIGLLADVIGFNRKLIEETLLRVKRVEMDHYSKNEDHRTVPNKTE